MQATNFLTLRGGYLHHRSSNLRPSVLSYSLLRHHNYVALRSSSTVRKSCFTSNHESHGKPRNEYMEEVLKWATLSPLNEEYPEELKNLLPIFSAGGLFRYRTIVQVKRLLKQSEIPELIEVPKFSQGACSFLTDIIYDFHEGNMHEVEKVDHVNENAVIDYLKDRSKYDEISKVLQNYQNTCNSEVIKLAFGMMLKKAINSVIVPRMTDICKALFSMADDNHVSSAPPYTLSLGQELFLVVEKLSEQAKRVSEIVILGQFRSGGDNYNGDRYAEIDWRSIDKEFVTSLGLEFDSNVDSKNHINKLILEVVNFNKIVVDFNNELQSYISSGYFKLEGDPIKFETNKIKTLDIKRPHSKVDSENHINKILVNFDNELESYISSGYYKLEGDPIKLEINKINLLSLDNMIKTLHIKRPLSKRGLAGILADMPQDLTGIVQDLPQDLVGVLGYSLVGYEAMLQVLKKLQ